MTLLRAAARTMLASYFIASGIKAVRDPDALVPIAEPLTDKFVPLIKQYAPDQVASYVPDDAKTLVRINGAAQVFGGLALATGKGRRLGALLLAGSLVPSTVAKHAFWSETDPEAKAAAKSHFLKNVSLLGGVLLASRDTEGQPSLAWRAQKGGQSLAKDTRKAAKKLTKGSSSLSSSIGDGASDLAGGAVAGGAALLGAVAATSRKARKEAAKQFADAQKAATKAAKQAKKDAPKQLRAARKLAAEQADHARAAAKVAQKEGRKQLKVVKKQAKKVRKNISLGEN